MGSRIARVSAWIAVGLLVAGGVAAAALLSVRKAGAPTRSERADAFLSDLLASVTSSSDLLEARRVDDIEKEFGAKYADLSEYQQFLFQAGWWEKIKAEADNKPYQEPPVDHAALALEYAPRDAGVRFLVAGAEREKALGGSPAGDDPDVVYLGEMRKVTAMEPGNGAYHLWRAEAAWMLGESKEAFAEMAACARSRCFRTPRWWPAVSILDRPPEHLTGWQFVSLEGILPVMFDFDVTRLKETYQGMMVAVNIGAPVGVLTDAHRALCAAGRDENGDTTQALSVLSILDMLAKYGQEDLYVGLTPAEKAGFVRLRRDIRDAQRVVGDGLGPIHSQSETVIGRLEKEGASGADLVDVMDVRFCRRELPRVFDRLAAFDFEHPERYGAKDERK
jgi:hypothetical protein